MSTLADLGGSFSERVGAAIELVGVAGGSVSFSSTAFLSTGVWGDLTSRSPFELWAGLTPLPPTGLSNKKRTQTLTSPAKHETRLPNHSRSQCCVLWHCSPSSLQNGFMSTNTAIILDKFGQYQLNHRLNKSTLLLQEGQKVNTWKSSQW